MKMRLGMRFLTITAVMGLIATGCGVSTASSNSAATSKISLKPYQTLAATVEHATPSHFEGPTTPAKAPKHIKLAVISCDSELSGCESPVVGASDAAKFLGWQVQTYNGGGTATQANADMLDAIQWGAQVILNVAISPNEVQLGLKDAKQHGVIVGSGSNGINTPNPVIQPAPGDLGYAFDVSPNYVALGKGLAAWFIAKTNGHADLAFFSDPEFPSVLAMEKGFLSEVKNVPGIKVSKPIDFTATEIGTTLGQMTTGYLQAHPNVNWIWSPEDPAAAAQVSAIQSAGMASRVRLMSQVGSQQNLNFIRNGLVQVADGAYDNEYMGWAMVDQSIRLLDKMPLWSPEGENDPYEVITKANVPPPGTNWTAPFNYKADFEKLWR